MKTIYFAAPLFTLAERDFNERLAKAVSGKLENVNIILPQDFTAKFPKDDQFFPSLFKTCINGIDQSDIVLAILDGPDADSGTCVEIGYAFARNKKVIGIRTDIRISEDRGLNLMVSQLCSELVFCLDGDMDQLASLVITKLKDHGVR